MAAPEIQIDVRYYALLKELAGKDSEQLRVAAGEPASAVYAELAGRYGFPLALSDVRVAINDEFASSDHPLQDGDRLVFIPPVSGG